MAVLEMHGSYGAPINKNEIVCSREDGEKPNKYKGKPLCGQCIDEVFQSLLRRPGSLTKQMLALGWGQDHRSPAEFFSKLWSLSGWNC